jgi:hypothetical protein
MACPPCAWPAAVSPLVSHVVARPERPARVLGVFPTALYLATGRHEEVLPVVAGDGLRLPTAVLLARRAADIAWGVEVGDRVVVGGGRVRLPGHDVVGVRAHRPCRVGGAAGAWGAQASPAAYVTGLEIGERPHLSGLATELVAAAHRGRAVDRQVAGLLGVGGGLTPSGDDALCGVLLALRGVGGPGSRAAHAGVVAALRPRLDRTTSLSASLLIAAAQGYAVPDVVRLVVLLTRSGDAVDDVLARVLTIGHSSGADLVAGLVGALAAVRGAAVPCRTRTA